MVAILVQRFVLHLEHQQEKREYGTQKAPQIGIFSPFARHDESEDARNSEKQQDKDQLTHDDNPCMMIYAASQM